MRYSTRQLVLLAIFGALWGLVEISLGSVFHVLNLPFSGTVLAGVGLGLALIGRLFVPSRGSTLFIGVIAMILKLFSLGGIVIGPMIGILAEALIAEVVLSSYSRPSLPGLCLAGSLGVLWTIVQPFFTGLVLFGRQPFVVWLDLIDEGSRVLGLSAKAALWILLILIAIHAGIGLAAGWLAWKTGERLKTRFGNYETYL